MRLKLPDDPTLLLFLALAVAFFFLYLIHIGMAHDIDAITSAMDVLEDISEIEEGAI